MNAMEAAALDAVLDRTRSETDLQKLRPGDNAVLSAGKRGHGSIASSIVRLTPYFGVK